MKFNRLRILGFKSFVEPTEFQIEPGLTGVVGPNGCGKSNLAEALRWVMGESSYKNMRAGGMDEVIFSGSGNRPRRDTAEVTLVIDNSERRAPAAFNDADLLEVTRRIEREMGSAYRVNGREVRARDVQLLFADASTGAHSPAMVGQGRIGELIAAKPQARRALLEEAAGTMGLHGRRHEAELRLRSAEQNLERVEDLLREIETQLESLKRQARQAIRYRGLSGEVRKAEAMAFYLRFVAAEKAASEAETVLAEAAEQNTVRAEAQASAARDQAVAASGLPALREGYAVAAAVVQRLSQEGQSLAAEERRINEKLTDLEGRLRQAASDIERELGLAAQNAEAIERLAREDEELARAGEGVEARRAEAETARAGAAERLGESERGANEATAALADFNARLGQLRSSRGQAEDRQRRQSGELGKVRSDLDQLRASFDKAAELAAAAAEVETAGAAVTAAEAKVAAAEQAALAAREAENAARPPLAEAERGLSRSETEARTLANLLKRPDDKFTPAIDAVKAPSGMERALAAAFGEDLSAPLDAAAPVHWRHVAPGEGDAALPDGAASLELRVDAPAELKRRLAQTGLVDRADGPRLQETLRAGQQLVSKEGDLWRWDGFVAGANAPTAAAQRLANRNRLAELEGEVDEFRRKVATSRAALEEATAAARRAGEAERTARDEARSAQRRLDAARNTLAAAERAASQAAARLAALEEAESRLAAGLAETEAALQAATTALAELGDGAALNGALAVAKEKLAADRAALAEAQAVCEGLRREEDDRRRRIAAVAQERQSWQQRLASAKAHVEALERRKSEAEAERAELSEKPLEIAARRRALLSESEKAEAARAEAADKLATGETELARADQAARETLAALSEAREARGRAEERLTSARERLDEIKQRIAETLECEPAQAAELAELKPGAPLPELAQIDARVERLRQERERLGGVNLRAEEEANEVAARRETIVTERDDLVAAIQKLRQGIASLNKEGRERLLAAFEIVNGHFRRLFTHLFGGGTAELQLTESEDPLEAGLEILAHPPGKKPSSITLLSGGEQALTALALIFGVFLTNPAPICVLDEVDAPLDDANVERFCLLLEEMSRQTDTRFVVVTHNPITMARMSRLFGVTMAERGVSQLVSVDLETAEQFREAV